MSDQNEFLPDFEFRPKGVYSMERLGAVLAGLCSVQTFLSNLGLGRTGPGGRRFQNFVFGSEILRAMETPSDNSKPYQSESLAAVCDLPTGGPTPKCGRGRPSKKTGGFVPVTSNDVLTWADKNGR